uniref:Uncharacterized protein n=1 Tax=Anguilla anguilla TaxID=7936 RepID=A0A0E9VKQ4_ANGAN
MEGLADFLRWQGLWYVVTWRRILVSHWVALLQKTLVQCDEFRPRLHASRCHFYKSVSS